MLVLSGLEAPIKLLNGNIIKFAKLYATASNVLSFHDRHELHPWPKSKQPSPQEIFNISDKEYSLSTMEFNKLLRQKYNKFVKIYHPDVCNQLSLYDESNRLMTPETKRQRFDAIQSGYDLLKDPRKRVAYGRYNTTDWLKYKAESTSTFDAYRMANSHRSKYRFDKDEEFWRAGTWEDYYRMKYERDPPTQEEFDRNKYKILAGVLVVMAISTSIQFMMALDRTEQAQAQIHLNNLRSLQDLNNSYNIEGEPNTRFSRLRRLLIHRRSNIKDDEKLKDMEKQDADLLTDFARREVEKTETTDNLS